ncbi:MAG: AAA family ATPase [Clostridia bacterium]|nr:AAA family ATPase [Clostridia bacterium]
MKLKSIQVNGFGKLENKNIEFGDKINLVVGSNESGKSTLMGFIKAIFYGVNKNKAGNLFSEAERYKPWKDIEFSGKAEYEVDGARYSAFRDFNKNSTKIYDELGNEITKNYNKDKSRGILIGNEQFNIDEETFENTAFITQKNIDVNIDSQKNIIQKLTNMIQSGDENTSYENVTKKIEKILYEEVGTERTQNKPKNIVLRELTLKKIQKEQLIGKRDRQKIIENELKKIETKTKEISKEIEIANTVYDIKNKYQALLNEKRNIYEAEQKVIEKQKIEEAKKQSLEKKRINIAMSILSLIVVILTFILNNYLLLVTLVPIVVLLVITNIEKKNIEESSSEVNQFDLVIEELKKKENKELEQLEKNGIKKGMTDRKITELRTLIDGYEKNKNDYILQSHKLKLEEDSLEHGVNRLNELEEEIESLNEKKDKIEKKEESLKLALEVFYDSYEELKSKIVPDITSEIQKCVERTTNGEYTNIKYNDTNGIVIENKFGEIVTIDKLSVGTIDQIYLGFRLAILNKLSNVPIILDEAFAYYDDKRLENILKSLNDTSSDRQVLIFTCSEREKKVLDEINAEYTLIEM